MNEAADEKVKDVVVNPEAVLEERDKDVRLRLDQLVAFRDSLELFRHLKNKPGVERWPGSLVLRRYHPGEIVCRQGEPGMSAYYTLTANDERRLREARILEVNRTMIEIDLDKEPLSVHLAIAKPVERHRGVWERLRDAVSGHKPPERAKPKYIPIDAPVDVNYETRQATLKAGEIFGEMSCLFRTPRSATIVAEDDCYVLEMLRNILDQIKRDVAFKKAMDDKYRERVLGLQLLNLPLFQQLPAEFVQAWVKQDQRIQLKSYRGEQIICDEHDRSDDMFVIRGGMVKVSQGVTALYSLDDFKNNFGTLGQRLRQAPPGSRLAAACGSLSGSVKAQLGRDPFHATDLSDAQWQAVVSALNDEIKKAPPPLKPPAQALPDAEVRRRNRDALDTELAGAVRPLQLAAGPETIITYLSKGELVGEMGVMLDKPRSASCVATVHRRYGQALQDIKSTDEEVVEVVHIPAAAFQDLLNRPEAAQLEKYVTGLIQERKRLDARRKSTGADASVSSRRRYSKEFEELSLIQGQRLMLIDLDRCTRCDECVQACADTHTDGRSRLFLEGPRFEHYLVPLTCRSCLDPVCLIGCPVGAIHRGDNREIRIEDWCIGCDTCAKQCPYGSIQMHDIGVIASGARGWRFAPDLIGFDPGRIRWESWQAGTAPFTTNRAFRDAVGDAPACWFARKFDVPKEYLAGEYTFELELFGLDPDAHLYINGKEVLTEERYRNNSKSRAFPITETGILHTRNNKILVRISLKPEQEGRVFDLRMDAVRKPERSSTQALQYSEKAVQSRAVVCDLCSDSWTRTPACVNACPHEAALRVDARLNFPAT